MNVTFDWNEWFFIISSILAFTVYWPIRSYFPRVIVIMIWVYNITLVATIDYFLLATPFKLYIFGDNPTYELSGALFHFFMYPCASLIFLYGYDKFELYGRKLFCYIFFWTVFALLFEWVTVKNKALTYTGWSLYYSIPVYPVAAIMLVLFFRFIKKKVAEFPYHEMP
ncbi:hypothetical protein GCM10008967_27220 [Bacillus carboniphilus]|uniref:Integral membrane protein n=1 Tax=Bacillus carboniphilus TaxID=86663 RepID=A0ABP3G6F9_9BACI